MFGHDFHLLLACLADEVDVLMVSVFALFVAQAQSTPSKSVRTCIVGVKVVSVSIRVTVGIRQHFQLFSAWATPPERETLRVYLADAAGQTEFRFKS